MLGPLNKNEPSRTVFPQSTTKQREIMGATSLEPRTRLRHHGLDCIVTVIAAMCGRDTEFSGCLSTAVQFQGMIILPLKRQLKMFYAAWFGWLAKGLNCTCLCCMFRLKLMTGSEGCCRHPVQLEIGDSECLIFLYIERLLLPSLNRKRYQCRIACIF